MSGARATTERSQQNGARVPPAVATSRCMGYSLDPVREAVGRCVEELPELQERFRNARNVLVKPNLLSSSRGPDSHVNTHPSLGQALAELLIGQF